VIVILGIDNDLTFLAPFQVSDEEWSQVNVQQFLARVCRTQFTSSVENNTEVVMIATD